jgi:hypothetical protein
MLKSSVAGRKVSPSRVLVCYLFRIQYHAWRYIHVLSDDTYTHGRIAAGAAGGISNGDSLLALKEVLLRAREETVKLQAQRDAVSDMDACWEPETSHTYGYTGIHA